MQMFRCSDIPECLEERSEEEEEEIEELLTAPLGEEAEEYEDEEEISEGKSYETVEFNMSGDAARTGRNLLEIKVRTSVVGGVRYSCRQRCHSRARHLAARLQTALF